MHSMYDKIQEIWPELAMFAGTCIVMVMGLSPRLSIRRMCAPVAAAALALAGVLAAMTTPEGRGLLPGLMPFAKVVVSVVGLALLLLLDGTVDRTEERLIASGQPFNPLRTNRAEFYAFFLFSLTGVMLCASASDLIWLFLALELTSLPTYIMVTISRTGKAGARAQEAGVKYFFLGAMGAATFLFGFALLYGATGTTNLSAMKAFFSHEGGITDIALAGMLMSLLGIAFKIAAVPMHLYTPDVYEGAAAPVSAFLAFTPKTAGFISMILLCSTFGWTHIHGGGPGSGHSLPDLVRLLLWVMAALTMTVGNVLAILQSNVKRMLAYSSIAHSGYMLVGLIAGPGSGRSITDNGLAAVLFYLLAYGVMNMGAFAVLACLERQPGPDGEYREIETVDDLRGLCKTQPVLGWTMVICALSLLGFPPLLGFFAKVPLFTSAIAAGEVTLVIVLGINAAIAAYYYLRLVAMPLLEEPDPTLQAASRTPFVSRPFAAIVSAASVIVLVVFAGSLMQQAAKAGKPAAAPTPSGHAAK
jgi:NADH-quinone oxidoreductase subunit N